MTEDPHKVERYAQKHIIPFAAWLFLIVSFLQIGGTLLILRYFALQQTKYELAQFTHRVSQGLLYKNGRWDTSRYTADPETPHPSGSSGFSTPLYIISADGFVIERNAPISGLLDSSDFSHLIDFQKGQNVSIVTNEQWRVISKPIVSNGKPIGVIVGALYHPERFIPAVADSKINNTINYLQSQISITNGNINVSGLDLRGIEYDVSFEIVNNFNKVLLNNGRTPTYIDKSYVYHELESGNTVRTVVDPSKKISYMVTKQILYDSDHTPVGIVLAGRSISYLTLILSQALPYIVGLLAACTMALIYLLRKQLIHTIDQLISFYEQSKQEKTLPSSIEFNKRDGKLVIGKHSIDIPLDSNQYYFCKAIFSNIKKRWELDELQEEFGDDTGSENWRKIYDTMTVINKKTAPYLPLKLIELREKTYFLNPELQSIVKSGKDSAS